jgi:chain length determinant protein (polysaccharide antigen chain regulator)
MNNTHTNSANQSYPPQYIYPTPYPQDDQIDLTAVFFPLFTQWRWLVGITTVGTVIAIVTALLQPKIYAIDARLAQPTPVDIGYINTRGYATYTEQDLFTKFYKQLRSDENFREFIITKGWLSKLPDADATMDEQFVGISENLTIEILEPLKKKGESNDLPPSLLSIKLITADKIQGVNLVNDYIAYTDQYVINKIIVDGMALRDVAKESIELKVDAIRNKTRMDRTARLVKLADAYNVAKAMGIKKPTTIESMAQTEAKTQTMVIGGNVKDLLPLMGTDYLENEMQNVRKRPGTSIFIEQTPELQKQLVSKKTENEINAFKELVADDAYIEELPELQRQLTELNQLTFDFKNVHSYLSRKNAMIDRHATKPNKIMIVALGFFLSFMIGIFYVLIKNVVNKESY